MGRGESNKLIRAKRLNTLHSQENFKVTAHQEEHIGAGVQNSLIPIRYKSRLPWLDLKKNL